MVTNCSTLSYIAPGTATKTEKKDYFACEMTFAFAAAFYVPYE